VSRTRARERPLISVICLSALLLSAGHPRPSRTRPRRRRECSRPAGCAQRGRASRPRADGNLAHPYGLHERGRCGVARCASVAGGDGERFLTKPRWPVQVAVGCRSVLPACGHGVQPTLVLLPAPGETGLGYPFLCRDRAHACRAAARRPDQGWSLRLAVCIRPTAAAGLMRVGVVRPTRRAQRATRRRAASPAHRVGHTWPWSPGSRARPSPGLRRGRPRYEMARRLPRMIGRTTNGVTDHGEASRATAGEAQVALGASPRRFLLRLVLKQHELALPPAHRAEVVARTAEHA